VPKRKRKLRKPTASAHLPSEAFDIEIAAVCRSRSVVLLSDWDTELPMQMLDAEGDETDNGNEAVAALIEVSEDCFISLDLTAWEKPTLH
jgi:hypothetical protein